MGGRWRWRPGFCLGGRRRDCRRRWRRMMGLRSERFGGPSGCGKRFFVCNPWQLTEGVGLDMAAARGAKCSARLGVPLVGGGVGTFGSYGVKLAGDFPLVADLQELQGFPAFGGGAG